MNDTLSLQSLQFHCHSSKQSIASEKSTKSKNQKVNYQNGILFIFIWIIFSFVIKYVAPNCSSTPVQILPTNLQLV